MDDDGCRGGILSSRSGARSLLQDHGYAIVPLSDHVAASLTIALKAFEGQLGSWGRHPPPDGYTGFTVFPGKSRLEFRPGHAGLGNLGVLQLVASQVVQTYESFAQAFLSQVALALSMPANAFLCVTDSTTQGSRHVAASSLEAIHYPAPDAQAAQSANCEAHVDRGLLTCIFADSIQGLQVQHTSGDWKHVTLPAGHVTILPGYTLERATCGLVKATTHRVVMETSAAPSSRNALVYKLRARESAILNLYSHLSPGNASTIPARLRGPIAVSELMHFFLATHESINDPSKADKLDSASFDQPLKRVKTEAAVVPPVASTPQAQTQHAEQSQGQGIQIVSRSQDGIDIHFRVTPTILLHKVFFAYADKRSQELDSLKFVFEGDMLCPYDTVQKFGIENGDVIDVMVDMLGD